MIRFPMIWLIFPIGLVILIITSWLLANSGRLKNRFLRNCFVITGAFFGFFSFVLPFFDQPIFHNIILNYGIGIPLAGG